MRNFDYSKLKERTWDNEILSLVSKIHEYKGKNENYFKSNNVKIKSVMNIASSNLLIEFVIFFVLIKVFIRIHYIDEFSKIKA